MCYTTYSNRSDFTLRTKALESPVLVGRSTFFKDFTQNLSSMIHCPPFKNFQKISSKSYRYIHIKLPDQITLRKSLQLIYVNKLLLFIRKRDKDASNEGFNRTKG